MRFDSGRLIPISALKRFHVFATDMGNLIERDLDYYRRRLAEERARAAQCDLPEIMLVHRQLAEMYGERVERLAGEDLAALS